MFCLHVNKVKGGEKAETSDFAHIEGITMNLTKITLPVAARRCDCVLRVSSAVTHSTESPNEGNV